MKHEFIEANTLEKEVIELLEEFHFEIADHSTINKIGKDCSEIMYKYGYNDNYSSKDFHPVIVGINIKVEIQTNNVIHVMIIDAKDDSKIYNFYIGNKTE